MEEENQELKHKCDRYEVMLKKYDEKVEVNIENVAELNEKQNQWKKGQEKEKVSFKEIMEQQIKEETKVSLVKVIKKKGLVKDAVYQA